MNIRDVIALLEDTSNNGNIKITKVDYYESSNCYKNRILKGEIQICVKYEENNGEKNEKD